MITKSWQLFEQENSELAQKGRLMLFRQRIGLAFLATLRKDGAPRLHPVSLVLNKGHLYVLIPRTSPKCSDLLRDNRYALQAFPFPGQMGEEFFASGEAQAILEAHALQELIEDTHIKVCKDEILFELLFERVMYSTSAGAEIANEETIHLKWQSTQSGNRSS